MTGRSPLRLFEATGVEIEFVIVDAGTLSVAPLADRVLEAEGGGLDLDVERGPVAWSNELALHVIEMKTNGPAGTLAGLARAFQADVGRVHEILAPLGARLMPTAMHPWMDPERELRLWPHGNGPIYRAFDRIFGCRGHGWANLQSTHVNLPFGDPVEFGRLHAAVRMALPLLPALAASSPLADGGPTGWMDTRLEHYRRNSRRIPSVTGMLIPERVFTREDYEWEILERIWADTAPEDPDGILRHEWANARGAIARFDRDAIEIRVLDAQECPMADVAVAAMVIALVRSLVEEGPCSLADQKAWDERDLLPKLLDASRDGDRARMLDARYLRDLGYRGPVPCTAGEVWAALYEATLARDAAGREWRPHLETILDRGCLARRIAEAAGPGPRRGRIEEVYRRLCDCLRDGEGFLPESVPAA